MPDRISCPEDIQRVIFDRSNGVCPLCGDSIYFSSRQKGDRGAWNIGHKVPLTKGGTNSVKNLHAICWDCNNKQGTMTNSEMKKRMKPDGWTNKLKAEFENDSVLNAFGIRPRVKRYFDED